MGTIITIGNDVINRASNTGTNNATHIDTLVPANGSGLIKQIQVWSAVDLTNLRIGIFRLVSGTTYKCIDVTGNLGTAVSGAVRTFSVNLYVKAGDCIGFYQSSGQWKSTSTGGALKIKTAYQPIIEDAQNYSTSSTHIISIKATGVSDLGDTLFNHPKVGFTLNIPLEHGSSIVPVLFNSETNYTPFIKQVQAGNTIIVEAPKKFLSRYFGHWKRIVPDGMQFLDNPLTLEITQPIEIRAIYFSQMFNEDVYYAVGSVIPHPPSTAFTHPTVSYTVL